MIKGNKIIDHIQYGTSEELNEEFNGFPILRLNEFDGFFLDIPRKYCNKISKDVFNNLLLKKGDVLVCRTNGNPKLVGKSAIVMEDINIAFASYLFRIKTKISSITPITLSVYLNSKIGRREIERNLMVSNQSNFSPATLRDIKIPIFPQEFQKLIDDIVTAAYHNHKHSKLQYSQAETLLSEELGLKDFNLTHEPCYEVNSYDTITANRIDGEYYQPKYEHLISAIKKNATSYKNVNQLCSFNSRGLQPTYTKEGNLKVINSKHILEQHLDYDNFERTDKQNWEFQKEARVFKYDILIYTTGANVGRTNIYLDDEQALASNHVNILRLREGNSVYVSAVLNSIIGRLQTRRLVTGSAQVELYPSDINKFVVPFVSTSKQEQIAGLIVESFSARRRAKALLEEAKKKVEEMIEKGQG
ncbi:MAG: restriction endonuclease subunit S [Thermodesulfovibrionales bacterium]|nr:restriction endonuclease subunit S [Thermodesulfovibrionales bacterium]